MMPSRMPLRATSDRILASSGSSISLPAKTHLHPLDALPADLPVEDAHLLGQPDEGLQLGEGLVGEGGHVDGVLDDLAAQPGDDLGHDFLAHPLGGLEGGGAQVRGAHHGVELVERMALLRLVHPGVDAQRGYVARFAAPGTGPPRCRGRRGRS